MRETSTISNRAGRLFSGLAIVWLSQFGIILWFMIGQGYDRATAGLVPLGGLALIPLVAWAVRAGLPALEDSTIKRLGMAHGQALALYVFGILVPAWIILRLLALPSPFLELWWMVGASTVILGSLVYYWKTPTYQRAFFALFFLVGCVASLPGWRLLIFSFFR